MNCRRRRCKVEPPPSPIHRFARRNSSRIAPPGIDRNRARSGAVRRLHPADRKRLFLQPQRCVGPRNPSKLVRLRRMFIDRSARTAAEPIAEEHTMNELASAPRRPLHELRFMSLFNDGRGLAFPCDAAGHVDLDGLSERSRENYFYARTFIGREFFLPSIRSVEH